MTDRSHPLGKWHLDLFLRGCVNGESEIGTAQASLDFEQGFLSLARANLLLTLFLALSPSFLEERGPSPDLRGSVLLRLPLRKPAQRAGVSIHITRPK